MKRLHIDEFIFQEGFRNRVDTLLHMKKLKEDLSVRNIDSIPRIGWQEWLNKRTN